MSARDLEYYRKLIELQDEKSARKVKSKEELKEILLQFENLCLHLKQTLRALADENDYCLHSEIDPLQLVDTKLNI
jgi:hypothetical protein